MEHFAGIDVSLEHSSVCVVDGLGKTVREAKVASEPEALVRFFRGLETRVTRIGLEAGPLSKWLHAGLVAAGSISLFNAHYDELCFLPIHVYDTATSRPVAVLLRPGKTPSGIEVRGHLRRLVRRIRKHWPATRITIRGDSHYGRPEVMEWCDENGIDFIFGLAGNAVLDRLVDETADDIRTRRALDQKPCLRGFAETSYP